MKKIIVIGGLSAGPSAAAKARRMDEKAKILLFEKTANISYATCGIPYALSGKIADRDKLMVVKPELLEKRFKIEMHLKEEVLDILPDEHKVITALGEYRYDKLIYAAGGTSIVPPIAGLESAENWSNCRTIEHFDKMMDDHALKKAQRVAVVGGGLIGVEVAENLAKMGKETRLIEMAPQALPMWDGKFGYFAESVLKEGGVDVITNAAVKTVEVQNGKIEEIILNDGRRMPADYLIIAVGVKPNTDLLLKRGAAHIANGAVKVNEKMETSLPDIYAAGDCASIVNLQTGEHDYFPLGTHSNKGGRTAGANAAGGEEIFKGAYKTAIIKIFDHTLARTGFNARSLKMANRNFKASMTITGATPGYYPGQEDLFLEAYYEPESRKLLGAEIFGKHGVDKRIDVLSACIYAGLTIDDLPQLDLAYAPPFSPAKDPVAVAGYVAANGSGEAFREMNIDELEDCLSYASREKFLLLDVRAEKEAAYVGQIPGAVNIPLDELRDRLYEVGREKKVVVYCARGLRGYLAARILANNGYKNIFNLSAGFKAWAAAGRPVEKVKFA